MKIIQAIMSNNPCYKAGRKITPKGLMLHSVGCSQPSAEVFIRQWNVSTYSRACVHGFIDANTGNVHQTLPWNHRGWHAGGTANNTHIGVEMCEPSQIKYTGGSTFTVSDPDKAKASAIRTYESAVELFAQLCERFSLDPSTIVSHKEGHAKGIASNHGDPEHLWKGLGLSYTMNDFRDDVRRAMGKQSTTTQKTSENANQGVTGASYKVKITTSELNVRKGAGTKYGISTVVKKGEVFTIVDEAMNGSTKWGKLKSGAGWISLKYTQKI